MAALAFATERASVSLLERLSLRALGVACLLTLVSVAANYSSVANILAEESVLANGAGESALIQTDDEQRAKRKTARGHRIEDGDAGEIRLRQAYRRALDPALIDLEKLSERYLAADRVEFRQATKTPVDRLGGCAGVAIGCEPSLLNFFPKRDIPAPGRFPGKRIEIGAKRGENS